MQRLPITLGFGGFTVEDLCLVAISKYPLVLDKSVCSKLGIESAESFNPSLNYITSAASASNSVSRILSSLVLERHVKAKTGNTDLIQSLLNQLNADNIEPIITTPKKDLSDSLDVNNSSFSHVEGYLGRSILIYKLISVISDYSDCTIGLICEMNGVKNIPIAELQLFSNAISSTRNLQWLLQDSKYLQKFNNAVTDDTVKQLIADIIVIIGNIRLDSERALMTCKNFLAGRINAFKQQDFLERIFTIQLDLHILSMSNNIKLVLDKLNNLNSIINGINSSIIDTNLSSVNDSSDKISEIESITFKWIDLINNLMNQTILKATNIFKTSKKSEKGSIGQILGFGKGNLLFEQFFSTNKWLIKDYNLFLLSREISELLVPQNQLARKPKVPKGTQDFGPKQMAIRSMLFDKIKTIFLQHGAVEIDTPVFELRETLMNKYGDEQKLIFELKDQGGEQLALRYDLTIPFARFIASQQSNKIKRFHIGKVYRRDEPQMNNGRFREFVQCDFDISGDYDSMIPDAEVVYIICRILESLEHLIGTFKIKISHRKLLDAIMEISQVPKQLRKSISSSIDKLDKESWQNVESEMIQKGLTVESIQSLQKYISQSGTITQVLDLIKNTDVSNLDNAKIAISELELFNDYLKSFYLDKEMPIILDLSLARGLDYYTGLIYESVLNESPNIGSVAAGGRYDGLIGSFSSTKVPAIGLSIGVERLYRVIESKFSNYRTNDTKVYVCSVGEGMILERMRICSELWKANIAAEFTYALNPKIKRQLESATAAKVPLVVIIGPDELEANCVIIKYKSGSGEQEKWEQMKISRSDMILALNEKILSQKNGPFN